MNRATLSNMRHARLNCFHSYRRERKIIKKNMLQFSEIHLEMLDKKKEDKKVTTNNFLCLN